MPSYIIIKRVIIYKASSRCLTTNVTKSLLLTAIARIGGRASTMSSTATLLMYFLSTSWVLHCNLSVKLACKLRLRQPSYRMRSCRTIFLNRMLCLHICVLPFSHTNTAYQWGGSWTALLDPLCRMMAGQIFLFFVCKVWLKKKDAHI